MSGWQQLVRENGLIEAICPHGVGHPSGENDLPDDSALWVHGCDGCCGPSFVGVIVSGEDSDEPEEEVPTT
jgi:hypothetical protein